MIWLIGLGKEGILTYDHKAPIVRVARWQPKFKLDRVVAMTIGHGAGDSAIGNIAQ